MTKPHRPATGFTLIELLIVIAIIGVLASVVLGSLSDARTSGADATIKQSISNIRAQSGVYYNQSGFTYEGFCDDPDILAIRAGINDSNGENGTVCNDNVSTWVISSVLVSTSTEWCIDHSGFIGERTTALASGETACPAT